MFSQSDIDVPGTSTTPFSLLYLFGQFRPFRPGILRAAARTDERVFWEWVAFNPLFAYSLGGPFLTTGFARNQDVIGHLVTPTEPGSGLHSHPRASHASPLVYAYPLFGRGLIVHGKRDQEDRRYPSEIRKDLPHATAIATMHHHATPVMFPFAAGRDS